MIDDDQNEWDKYLGSVLFAHRTNKQASTRFFPFYCMDEIQDSPLNWLFQARSESSLALFYLVSCMV